MLWLSHHVLSHSRNILAVSNKFRGRWKTFSARLQSSLGSTDRDRPPYKQEKRGQERERMQERGASRNQMSSTVVLPGPLRTSLHLPCMYTEDLVRWGSGWDKGTMRSLWCTRTPGWYGSLWTKFESHPSAGQVAGLGEAGRCGGRVGQCPWAGPLPSVQHLRPQGVGLPLSWRGNGGLCLAFLAELNGHYWDKLDPALSAVRSWDVGGKLLWSVDVI